MLTCEKEREKKKKEKEIYDIKLDYIPFGKINMVILDISSIKQTSM